MYKSFLKPLFDFLIAVIILLVLSPLILTLIPFLYVLNNGEIFLIQKRPGLNGKPFNLIKFKTMRDLYDSNGNPLPDMERITKIGLFMRAGSLDEILQFINVIKGDMSLVGPRPLLMKYLDRYTEYQNQRHDVKPGITGLAQVNGRNNLSWEEKFEFDVHYVKNQSFLIDLNILFKTAIVVILKRGVNQDKRITMKEFKGTNDF
jgi:undecaprenyl phosphate N,N'-diacetylbacillosamine 1-phosphate transferase